MDSEHWQIIKQLFTEAVELPLDEQQEFVAHACGDQAELLAQVQRLLRDHHRAGDFIETPVLGRPGLDPTATDLDPLQGQTVGHYKILHKIGQGGMSTVYLAARADQQYQQHVAVKIIRRGMNSDFIVARFRQERQILASLDHPSIARLLDGGTLADGRPYLVMEHIDGEPVDTYCERADLSLRQRLELFCKICSAVQYAHQNLVVHRDLKPSNILVTADGVPRVLDFGTAKLLEPLPVMMGVTPTAADLRPMTPEYASPEQMRGTLITTASDVYSLGVVLYELTTGQRPYRLPERISPEAARIVTEEPIERPSLALSRPPERTAPAATPAPGSHDESRTATTTKLRRKLEGDLDNIVLMALRKEPKRRYPSVEQLANDIERHLRGLPVSARRDTLSYRTSKFVLRHRLGVAATVLAVASLLAGIVAISWQARIADRERQRAEDSLAEVKAEQIKNERTFQFLAEIFQSAGTLLGEELTVKEAFDRAVEVLNSELADQPGLRAALLDRFGVLQRDLGLYERSSKQLEEAVALNRRLLGAEAPRLADSLDHLGVTLFDAGHYDQARTAFDEALRLRRQAEVTEDRQIAASLTHLGLLELQEGHTDLAETHFQEALDLHRANADSNPIDLAATLQGLGRAANIEKRYTEAEQIFRQTLEIQRQERGRAHPKVVEELNLLAKSIFAQGRIEEAKSLFLRELEFNRALHGASHPAIALTLNNLAAASYRERRTEEGIEYLRQALEIQRQHLQPTHNDLLSTLSNLGSFLIKKHQPLEAARYFRQVLEARRQVHGEQHPATALARHNLASALQGAEQLDQAMVQFRRALDFRTNHLGDSDPDTLLTRLGLSRTLRQLGRLGEAEEQLLIAFEAAAEGSDRTRVLGRRAAQFLAELYQQLGRHPEAEQFRAVASPPEG